MAVIAMNEMNLFRHRHIVAGVSGIKVGVPGVCECKLIHVRCHVQDTKRCFAGTICPQFYGQALNSLRKMLI